MLPRLYNDADPYDSLPPYREVDDFSPRDRSRPFGQSVADAFHHSNPMGDFDILDWYPAYQSCQKYFLDYAQYETATLALCALINIRLPHQWRSEPIYSSTGPVFNRSSSSSEVHSQKNTPQTGQVPCFVSLVPYVRRLIVTGFDTDGVLHGFFGDAWQAGTSAIRQCERRNYLFCSKSDWVLCKTQYDLGNEQTVPFMLPLKDVDYEEKKAARHAWQSWKAFSTSMSY